MNYNNNNNSDVISINGKKYKLDRKTGYIPNNEYYKLETIQKYVFNGIDCTRLCLNIEIEQRRKGRNFNPFGGESVSVVSIDEVKECFNRVSGKSHFL